MFSPLQKYRSSQVVLRFLIGTCIQMNWYFILQTKQLHKDGDDFLVEKKTQLDLRRTDMEIMILFLILMQKTAKRFKASFTDGCELYTSTYFLCSSGLMDFSLVVWITRTKTTD